MSKGLYFGGLGGGGRGPVGPIGATGANATPWTWRGTWTGGSYSPNQTVTLSGQTYICIVAVTNTGITNTNFWEKVASTGLQGPQGNAGTQGLSGSIGSSGSVGLSGIQGPVGIQGASGIIGPSGLQGPNGIQGPTGIQGPSGSIGPSGISGVLGPTGLQGSIGPSGLAGPASTGGLFGALTDVDMTNVLTNDLVVYDTGSNRWRPKFSSYPIWNVKDFGASGDGITDDLQAVINARNALNVSGGTLYFPGPATYRCRIDSHPSGFLSSVGGSYPILYLSKTRSSVLLDNDATVDIFANFQTSGTSSSHINIPLFGLYANNINIRGGAYTWSLTGAVFGVGNQVWNGYSLFDGGGILGTNFENISFSGCFGGSLIGGITNSFGEQIENTYWKNCKFINWGYGQGDTIMYHQGRTTLDNCQFIITDDYDLANRDFSHAIYTGRSRPYSSYKNVTIQNMRSRVVNAYAFHFYTSSPSAMRSYGFTLDGINLIQNSLILFQSTLEFSTISNCVSSWYSTGAMGALTFVGIDSISCYNSRNKFSFQGGTNVILNNNYDSLVTALTSTSTNLIINNCISLNSTRRLGTNLIGGTANSTSDINIRRVKNCLISNNYIENGNNNWGLVLANNVGGDNGNITIVDNYFETTASNLNAINTETAIAPINNVNILSNHFYTNQTTLPTLVNLAGRPFSGVVIQGNVFNSPFVNTTGGNTYITLSAIVVTGVMIKDNISVNARRGITINANYYNIGNHYYGNIDNLGTGTQLLSLYNTSGAT